MFDSFFIAGFECATGYNRLGQPIDQICATQHDKFMDDDYRLLREVGICAARDAVRWNVVDRRGHFDFSTLTPMLEAARRNRITVIYDLFHYGYPDDVDLFSDSFPKRFADYCYAVARYVADRMDGTCYFTPVNEPSYFAWAAGEAGLFKPHLTGRSRDLKVALASAAIQGINAIWDACPTARIVNADPICRVVTPADQPDLEERVDRFNKEVVFESLDMLSGRLLPELGGSRKHLDIVGVNYYWTNQWEFTREPVPLADDDPRRVPLRELLHAVWDRYGGDMIMSETSHVGERRAAWLEELAGEVQAVLSAGVPLQGVCLYPILGMPEWHDQQQWTRMGLWDLTLRNGNLLRIVNEPMLKALRQAQSGLLSYYAQQ